MEDHVRGRSFWFPNLSRSEADKMLDGKPQGAFVIRRSSKVGCLALSHRLPHNETGHALLFFLPNKGFQLEKSSKIFPALDPLLASLNLKIGLCKKPPARPSHVLGRLVLYQVEVLCPYSAVLPGELSADRGDVLNVVGLEGPHYDAELDGNVGKFPIGLAKRVAGTEKGVPREVLMAEQRKAYVPGESALPEHYAIARPQIPDNDSSFTVNKRMSVPVIAPLKPTRSAELSTSDGALPAPKKAIGSKKMCQQCAKHPAVAKVTVPSGQMLKLCTGCIDEEREKAKARKREKKERERKDLERMECQRRESETVAESKPASFDNVPEQVYAPMHQSLDQDSSPPPSPAPSPPPDLPDFDDDMVNDIENDGFDPLALISPMTHTSDNLTPVTPLPPPDFSDDDDNDFEPLPLPSVPAIPLEPLTVHVPHMLSPRPPSPAFIPPLRDDDSSDDEVYNF